jgi:hypothetical protein
LRHYATNQKVTGSIPDEVIYFFNLHNPSNYTVALRLIQPLTKYYHEIFLGSKALLACEVDNLTAICEQTMWEPQHFTTL